MCTGVRYTVRSGVVSHQHTLQWCVRVGSVLVITHHSTAFSIHTLSDIEADSFGAHVKMLRSSLTVYYESDDSCVPFSTTMNASKYSLDNRKVLPTQLCIGMCG